MLFLGLFDRSIVVAFASIAAIAQARSISAPSIDIDTSAFLDSSISYSAGGHAICVEGLVPIEITGAVNTRLNLSQSIDQFQATQLLLSLNSVNSSVVHQLSGPKHEVHETFNISCRLCYPKATGPEPNINSSRKSEDITTLQFLTHGIGFDQSYWDFSAPSNSYIDVAALAGRATFSYDRLGVGQSAHPDPIQMVQGPTEIAVAHSLLQMLRSKKARGPTFKHIIGVGHSYGSALTTSIAHMYPEDLDAVIVTGFSSSNITGATQFASSLNLLPAASLPAVSNRFPANLPDGYLLPSTQYGVQYSFFHYPDFEPSILSRAFNTIQTTTIGEQLTMDTVEKQASHFNGTVYVVNGEYDLFFCDGDCNYPTDISEATLRQVFPMASEKASSSLILPSAGHGLNLGSNAADLFHSIQEFVTKTGL